MVTLSLKDKFPNMSMKKKFPNRSIMHGWDYRTIKFMCDSCGDKWEHIFVPWGSKQLIDGNKMKTMCLRCGHEIKLNRDNMVLLPNSNQI